MNKENVIAIVDNIVFYTLWFVGLPLLTVFCLS